MNKHDLIRLAVDCAHGVAVAPAEFSEKRPEEVLRQALIDLNGGSAKFDYKNFRRNKTEMFEIIEEIVPVLVNEGLTEDDFFNRFVVTKNVNLGDKNSFLIEDDSLFVVAEMADGTQIPRRQRIGESRTVSVNTEIHGIRIYEEFSRFMAGRIDWNACIDKIARSYKEERLDSIYTLFAGITEQTPGMNNTYVTGGTYDEEALLRLVEHVEAKTGKSATIVGTKAALRKCSTAVLSDSAKEDYYRTGFFGMLAGVPMVSVKNRHAKGSDEFIFDDKKLYVIAGDAELIMEVIEGEPVVIETESTVSADMTMNYFYSERRGYALVIKDIIGIYNIA